MRVRICADCGEEFRPEVAVCSDCGGTLVDQWDGDQGDGEIEGPIPEEGRRAASAAAPPAEPETRPLAWAQQARELVPAADLLRAASLPFQIAARQVEGEERPRGYELRVRDEDRDPARAALASVAGTESGITLLDANAADLPAHEPGSRCPACETEVPAGLAECPGCGLGLGAAEPD
jgi:hypothetical protein